MREYERYQEQSLWPLRTSESSTTGSSLVWLLVGIGIGAGAALLLTPSTGRELRSAIALGFRLTVDGVGRGTRQLRQHGSNLISFNRHQQKSLRG